MVYAILIAIGDYKDIGAADIPTYKRDIEIMHRALNEGLRIPEENIRVITGNDNRGKVSMKSLAHAIADVEGHLSDEDVFLLYFSGHGQRKDSPDTAPGSFGASSPCTTAAGIVFSDGMVMLQSVIDYISRLAAGGKIVILDCCYSGGFEGKGPRTLQFDQAFSEFAGKGIAVMASTSADETARLWPERKCSVFTGALSQAIMELTALSAEGQTSALLEGQTPAPLTAGITRSSGRISLNDIYDVMMRIITIRNYHEPARQQYPVFRSSIGGTIYFGTKDRVQESGKMQHNCTGNIHHFKSLDTQKEKRLAVFVLLPPTDKHSGIPAGISTEELASAARDIVGRIRTEGMEEDVVWCYFGADEGDILNSLHYAYTIWTATEEMQSKYYGRNATAVVCDGIYVFRNTSYDLLKRIQEPTKTREEFVRDVKKLLALIVSSAESFVYDLQEVKNRTRTMAEMRALYYSWIGRVKSLYIKLSDEDIAPDDLHDWAEAIYDLAGWTADLAILFEGKCGDERASALNDNAEKSILIDHTIRRYHEAIERVRQTEAETAEI